MTLILKVVMSTKVLSSYITISLIKVKIAVKKEVYTTPIWMTTKKLWLPVHIVDMVNLNINIIECNRFF